MKKILFLSIFGLLSAVSTMQAMQSGVGVTGPAAQQQIVRQAQQVTRFDLQTGNGADLGCAIVANTSNASAIEEAGLLMQFVKLADGLDAYLLGMITRTHSVLLPRIRAIAQITDEEEAGKAEKSLIKGLSTKAPGLFQRITGMPGKLIDWSISKTKTAMKKVFSYKKCLFVLAALILANEAAAYGNTGFTQYSACFALKAFLADIDQQYTSVPEAERLSLKTYDLAMYLSTLTYDVIAGLFNYTYAMMRAMISSDARWAPENVAALCKYAKDNSDMLTNLPAELKAICDK